MAPYDPKLPTQPYGPIWSHGAPYYSISHPYGPIWPHMDAYEPYAPEGSTWTKTTPYDPNMFPFGVYVTT